MVAKGKRKGKEQKVVTIVRARGVPDKVSVSSKGIEQAEAEAKARQEAQEREQRQVLRRVPMPPVTGRIPRISSKMPKLS